MELPGETMTCETFQRPMVFWEQPRFAFISGVACFLMGLVALEAAIVWEVSMAGEVLLSILLLASSIQFYRGWLARYAPHTITLDNHGVVASIGKKCQTYPWETLLHVERETAAINSEPFLVVYDLSGRRILRIAGDFDEFERLETWLKEWVTAARTSATERVYLKRRWVFSIVLLAFGLFLLGMALFFLVAAGLWIAESIKSGDFSEEWGESVGAVAMFAVAAALGISVTGSVVLYLTYYEVERRPSGFGWRLKRERAY